jgi:hypothetical protein
VRNLDKICSGLQATAWKYFHRRETAEICIGVCFVSALVAVGATLPMI